MIPTQTFIEFPEFCDTGTKIKPDSAKYASGFVGADVLPAEWLNYFENKSSVGITDLNRGVSSIEKEMNSVLSAAGKTASESSTDQLVDSIKYLISQAKAEAILAAHPVGSLYWTESTENPNTTFGGGTWVQIKDKFILAAGNTYTNKATGGSATVTLTVNNLPSHSHTYTPAGSVSVSSHSHGLNNHTHSFTPAGSVTVSSHSHGLNNHTHTFTPAGTVTVSAHSHGLNNHTHTFSHTHAYTPSGTVSSHRHGERINIDNSGTPSGNIDKNTAPLIIAKGRTGTTGGVLGNSVQGLWIEDPYINTTNYQINTDETQPTFTGTAGTTLSQSTTTTGGNSGNTTAATPTATFSGTKGTTAGNTGSTADATATASFTGMASSTGGNSGNTAATTPTATFTGSSSTTLNTGSGTAVSTMPPYEVKFCWKRTA